MIKEWELVDFILFIEQNKKDFLYKRIEDLNYKGVGDFIHYMAHKDHNYGGFMWVTLIDDDDHVYSTSALGKFKIKNQNKVILKNLYNTRVNINFGNIEVFYNNCTHFIFDHINYEKYEDCVIYTHENYIPEQKGTNFFIAI